MTLNTLIAVNAALDLAVVLAVFAIVRFTHTVGHSAVRPEGLIPLPAAVPAETEKLPNAA
jgi:hypothetical protein